MKLATWNVNSLKVRLPHLLDWLGRVRPDIVCLQELKLEDAAFPVAQIEAAGYRAAFSGQKTYNGVAILTPGALQNVVAGIPGFADDPRRAIAADVDGVRVICVYCPNGQTVGSDKYEYKLRWYAALTGWLRDELVLHPNLAIAGDFNIAPDDRDVYDPRAWKDQVLCSEPERAAFRALLELGLADSFRLFEQPEKTYSWWDYRMLGFQKNNGLRIDHVLVSAPLAAKCSACSIDRGPRKLERPSDHAPVIAEFGHEGFAQ